MDEFDRRFAQTIMEQLATLASETACPRVALVASPRFLGHLRTYAGALKGLAVEEIARDLTREATPRRSWPSAGAGSSSIPWAGPGPAPPAGSTR